MNLIVTALFATMFALSHVPTDTQLTPNDYQYDITQDLDYPVNVLLYDSGWNVPNATFMHEYYTYNIHNNGFMFNTHDNPDSGESSYYAFSSKLVVDLALEGNQVHTNTDFQYFSEIRFSYTLSNFYFNTSVFFEHGNSNNRPLITNMYAQTEVLDPSLNSVTFSNVVLTDLLIEVEDYSTGSPNDWYEETLFQFDNSYYSNGSYYQECSYFRDNTILFNSPTSRYSLTHIIFSFDFIPEGLLNLYYTEFGSDEYRSGYDYGYEVGYEEGVEEGVDAQRDAIYDDGYQDAISDWKDFWYDSGYHDGEIHGMEVANRDALIANQIFTGIISIALVPVNFFLGILNFDVFGINIGALVSSLLTVLVLITIIKTIFGSKSGGTE